MNATKERQAWCCLQVKLCDPRLSALYVPWCEKALYKYSSFPFPFTVYHLCVGTLYQLCVTDGGRAMRDHIKRGVACKLMNIERIYTHARG